MSSLADCIKKHVPKDRQADVRADLEEKRDGHLADKVDGKESRIKAVEDALKELREARSDVLRQVEEKYPQAHGADNATPKLSTTTQPIPESDRANIPGVDNAAPDGVKSSRGSIDAALKKEGFKVNEKDREATDELESVVNYAFGATPWRLPDTIVGRDRKGRVEQGGTPRSDLEVAERLAKIFDKRIVWATFSNPTINGLIVSRNRALDGVIFVNPTSKNPAHVIFGHELSHWMEAEHPEIFAELYDAIQPLIIDTAAYRGKFANLQGASDFDVNTEIIGDVMGDAFGDPNFWGDVAQQSGGKKFRGIAKKVIQWVNSIIDKIRGMAGFGSRQLVRDLNRAKLAIARATSKYAEAKGNSGSVFAGGVRQSVASLFKPVDTNSGAFRDWARGSVVRDVQYHWTDAEFDAFDMEASDGMAHFGTKQAAADRAGGYDGIGYDIEEDDGDFWVYADAGPNDGEGVGPFKTESEAKKYIKTQPKRIAPIAVYLNIKNPLRVPDFGVWTLDGVRTYLYNENVINKRDADKIWKAWQNSSKDGYEALRLVLEKKGYDGFVYENEQEDPGSDSYVVLSPTQIKSATENTGDFSPTDPRIRFSRALPQTATEAFKRWFGNSKITKNGEPHILYHGTQHPHFLKAKEYPWIFDQDRPRNPGNSDLSGLGIFLGGMDAAEMHAGFEGTVHPFYIRMEKPYVTTAAELEKKVAASGTEAFKKRLQDLNGHDGIIIKDRGHAIVFDANQVKSAEQNTGAFSREDNDVRYSVAAKEYDEVETEIKEKVSEKYDMLPGARLFVTPEYSLVKTEAGKRAFDAARRRTEDKFELGNLILDGTTPKAQWGDEGTYQDHYDETHLSFLNTLDALTKEAYAKFQGYLLDTDKPGAKAFGVKHIKGIEVKSPDGKHVGFAKDKTGVHDIVAKHHRANYGEKSTTRMIDYQKEEIDKWVALDRDGKPLGRYDRESEAIRKMMEGEQQWLVDNGYSEGEAKAVRAVREATNRGFDLQVADLRRVEAEREKLGLPPLEVEIPDETKRYAIRDKRGNVVTTYEHLDDAERHLKELSKYKLGFSNVKVVRQTDSEIMRPGTINDYISVIGDLRGRYFPRKRQSGGVVLLAVNEKTGQKYRNNYDLWISKGRKYGQDGEEVSENKLLSYARGRFNALTPLGRKIRELQKEGYSVTVEKAERMPEEVFDVVGLTASINALMDESLKNVKTKDKTTPGIEAAYAEIHKVIAGNIANIFKERGGLSSRIRRSQTDYWEGFETDPKEAIVQYARTVAGTTAKRIAAQRIIMALTGRDISFDDFKADGLGETWEEYAEFVNDRKIDPKKQANLHKEALSWFKEIMRNDEQADRIIGTLKGLATLKYMGLRVSSAAVNLTNLVQAVPATISHYSGGSIPSALRQVTASLKVLADYKRGTASDLDKRIITEIKERGLDSAQFNHEAAAVLRSKVGNMGAKVADTMMWMFAKTESINRAATIHSAYMELKRTNDSLSHEKLMEKAIEVSNRAHGLYGDETAPVWTRGSGNPLRMTFTFAKFSQNYMLNMASMIGKKDYKNAAYMLLSPAILGGAGASLATPVLAALASAFGIGGDDPEEALYSWAEREFGSDSILRHGLPGLANINIKGSLAMNNPMPTTLEEVFGAPGSVIFDMRDAAREVRRGAYGKAFEKALPSAIVSPFKAAREYDEGVTTGSYSRVYYGDQPLKGTGYDAVLRGLSFNPSRLSGIREKQWREDKIARKYRAERNDINSKFKKAWISGNGKIDRGDWLELMGEVESYNERVQGLGMPDITPITKQSLRLMLRRQTKPNKRERMRV